MDLSETGHFHAAALADWFGDGALDRVYVSPMKRAAQTADPLLRARGLEGTVLEGLRGFTLRGRVPARGGVGVPSPGSSSCFVICARG